MSSSTVDLAAAFRGLPPVKQEEGKFKYVNSRNCAYDKKKDVKSVKFSISRYGKYEETIIFNAPVTQKDAIEAVEKYLSVPLTQEYYEKIQDDTFHEYPWETAKEFFKCRGAVMTDAIFLEGTKINSDGQLTFSIGS